MKHLKSPRQPVAPMFAGYRPLRRALRYVGVSAAIASLTFSTAIVAASATDVPSPDAPASEVLADVQSEVDTPSSAAESNTAAVPSVTDVPQSAEEASSEPRQSVASDSPQNDGGSPEDTYQKSDVFIAEDGRSYVDIAGDLIPVVDVLPSTEPIYSTPSAQPRSAFRAATAGPFTCQAGYVYSQNANGQIRVIDANTGEEGRQIVPAMSGANAKGFNATGIAPDGSYAIATQNVLYNNTVHRRFWKSTGGAWTSIIEPGKSDHDWVPVFGAVVAGAIDETTGDYFFGGYRSRARSTDPIQFEVWRMNKSTNATTKVANIRINGANTQALQDFNGDLAFDSEGNLFLVTSLDTFVAVSMVPRAKLESANGGNVDVKPLGTGTVSVKKASGIAFRADGSLILSSSYNNSAGLGAYDPFDFAALSKQPSYEGGTGTGKGDLASCDTPLTLLVQKNLVTRKESGDQFKLGLTRTAPATRISPLEETTTGSADGIQAEQVGPMPVVAGQRYSITESFEGTGTFTNKYQEPQWECRTNTSLLSKGRGVSFAFEPGAVRGEQITCTFTNTPTGSISWEKRSDDPATSLLSGSEWTLSSADVAGFTPRTIKDCTAPSACAGTNDLDPRSGYLKVDYLKDGTYTLTESKPPAGHKVDGTSRTFTVGTAKREHVAGAVTNPRLKASVTVLKTTLKEDGTTRDDAARASWEIGAALTGTTTGLTLKAGEQAAANQTTNNAGALAQPWNVFFDAANKTATLSLSETIKGGWDAKSFVCTDKSNGRTIVNVDLSNTTPTGGKVSASVSGLVPDQNVECIFTNARTPGTVTWTKVDEDSPTTKLAGSEWELTATGAPTITVRDCVTAGRCAGTNDEDPAPGQFKVKGLLYKNYTLRETVAPDGFKERTATNAVNVSATNREITLGNITNSHLTTNVKVKKTTYFADRTSRANAFLSGWEMTAALPTGTPAIVKLTVNGANNAAQTTQNNGQLPQPWTITHTSSTGTRSIILSEPVRDGWDALRLVCTEDGNNGQTLADVDLTKVRPTNGKISVTVNGLRPNVNVSCEFANAQTRGTITWDKVAAGTTTRIPGATWTITGGPEAITVTDCTRSGACAGTNDDDPTPGRFKVSDLLYNRQYIITETKAPTGYAIPANPSRTVTLTYADRDRTLDNVENERLSSTLRLIKVTQHADQTTADNTQRGGWELGAAGARGVDIKVNNVVTATQNTNSNGQVPTDWKLTYANDAQRHTVTISEVVKDGWDARSLVCIDTADNNRQLLNVDLSNVKVANGRISQTLTGLAPGGSVVCTFTNSKTRGTITWSKIETGTTKVLPGSEWNLNANNFGGANGVNITDCIADGQCAGTNDEDPRPGYFKVSDLLYRDFTLTETSAPAGYKIETASRRVNVNFDNRVHDLGPIGNLPSKATLRLVKETRDIDGTTAVTSDRGGWDLGATLPTGSTNSLKANNVVTNSQTTKPDGTVTHPWIIGFATSNATQQVNLSEPVKDGWLAVELVCHRADGTLFARKSLDAVQPVSGRISAAIEGIRQDDDITCTFVNKRQPGTVTWEKVDKDAPATHLEGATWTLTAPGATTVNVQDCTAQGQCAGKADTDPRAGYFSVTGLKWAEYTLTETKAPVGYKAERATTAANITAAARTVNLGTIPNVALKATIKVAKRTVEPGGANELPAYRSGWALGVALPNGAPATSKLTVNGSATATQDTNAQGATAHPWTLGFGAESDRQAVTVSEPARAGWTPTTLICTRPNGSVFHRADLTGVVATNDRISVTLPVLAPGDDVTCTFTSELSTGSVAWTKVDAGDNTALLSGSEWTLDKPDGTSVAITDCVSDPCAAGSADRNPEAGKFLVEDLNMGNYSLTETKAPAGFVLPGNPTQNFAVTAAARDVNLGAISNEQRAGVVIPLTGGSASDTFVILGGTLMTLSTAAAAVLMRRRRREQGA